MGFSLLVVVVVVLVVLVVLEVEVEVEQAVLVVEGTAAGSNDSGVAA